MHVVLNTVVPVFSIIALGYFLAGRRRIDMATIADLAMLITSPALIFAVLARTRLPAAQWVTLVGGTLWILVGTGTVAYLYLRRQPAGLRGLLLPAVFWNSGNMALPCAQLAFGDDGLEAAIVVFVTVATLQSTIAIWIAKGSGGWLEMLRLPLLYACVGGLVVAGMQLTIPAMVLRPIRMVGDMAIPLMLINLGVQLRTLRVTDLRHSLAAVTIRMGGGLFCALLFVALFAVAGVNRQVLLLDAIMPPAVINVVMAQRYHANPDLVASSIVVGTALSVLAIPGLLLAVA